MFNLLFLCLLLTNPVLFEGRFRPLETLPEGAAYVELDVANYQELAGTPYLEAEGKALYYPTYGQLTAEKCLFRIPFKWLIIGFYLLGALFFFWKKGLGWFFCSLGFFAHTLALGLRCYILMRPPVSNMAETILYVPWIVMGVGFIFSKKQLAAVTASILLFFLPAHASLSLVQPVLDSQYWLIIHVLMVVGSYGVFFFAGMCGHLLLVQKNPSVKLEKTLLQTLYIGTALLIGGTILGGIWAAESWGRFWDWDPKEAWAFISSGCYLIGIHAYRFKKIGRDGLAIGSILGLMAITFTWYGVNYILGTGLHSYGFGTGGEIFYYLYLAAEVIFLSTILIQKKLYKNWMIEKKDRSR